MYRQKLRLRAERSNFLLRTQICRTPYLAAKTSKFRQLLLATKQNKLTISLQCFVVLNQTSIDVKEV